MDEMREQALRFGADLRMEDVESVSLDGPVKSVTTSEARPCTPAPSSWRWAPLRVTCTCPVSRSCSAAA